MSRTDAPVVDADLLASILDVFTPAQALKLVDEIRQVKAFGYGRITIVVNCGSLRLIQAERSYDFRADEQHI